MQGLLLIQKRLPKALITTLLQKVHSSKRIYLFQNKSQETTYQSSKTFFIALPTSEELEDVIGTLINGKSAGPNNISTFIFQKIKEISQSLSVLIRKSFKNSIIRDTQNNTSCRSIEN